MSHDCNLQYAVNSTPACDGTTPTSDRQSDRHADRQTDG